MASTNKTTNYELSQFIETDRPAWLTDYNGDMRTIDSTMKAISDVASGASGSISELANRMSTAEGNITTNTNDIDALEARADSLEAQAQSTAGTIASIQTHQIAQDAGIEAATQLGYNLARPYDSASTYAVGAYVLFQNTLYKCITAVATGEAFDPTKWIAIKATDEIAAGGYTLPIASASQLGGVKVGGGLSIDPVSGILSASGGDYERVVIGESTGENILSSISTFNFRVDGIASPSHNMTDISNVTLPHGSAIFERFGKLAVITIKLSIRDIPSQNVPNGSLVTIDFDTVLNPNSELYPYISRCNHFQELITPKMYPVGGHTRTNYCYYKPSLNTLTLIQSTVFVSSNAMISVTRVDLSATLIAQYN